MDHLIETLTNSKLESERDFLMTRLKGKTKVSLEKTRLQYYDVLQHITDNNTFEYRKLKVKLRQFIKQPSVKLMVEIDMQIHEMLKRESS